jgi:ribosomal protein S20
MQRRLGDTGANATAKDLRAMISAIDKATKRGIIHRNAANRRKARLNKAAMRVAAAAGNQQPQGESEANS